MIASPIALALGTYFLASASPGPSNMAIMGAAMRDGRMHALILAAGVMTGSLFWAVLAATGIATLLATCAQVIFVIKVIGGIHLLIDLAHIVTNVRSRFVTYVFQLIDVFGIGW